MNTENAQIVDQDLRIGYIGIHSYEDQSIRGGILVIDDKTRPYEFRVTGAIKPTELQVILYGKSLAEYAYSDLILKPLINSLTEKLNFIVTKDRNLLNVRPLISIPVVYINENFEPNLEVIDGKERKVFYTTHRKFKSELQQIKTLLELLYEEHDLFEPFNRLREALIEIHRLKPESKT